MNMPPMIMQIRINREGRGFGLWLPLCIIVPIAMIVMLAFLIIILPLLLLATLILWRFDWWRPVLSLPKILGCLTAARGLEVDISKGEEEVFISVK